MISYTGPVLAAGLLGAGGGGVGQHGHWGRLLQPAAPGRGARGEPGHLQTGLLCHQQGHHRYVSTLCTGVHSIYII